MNTPITVLTPQDIEYLTPISLRKIIIRNIHSIDYNLNIIRHRIHCANGYTISLVRGDNVYCDMTKPNNYEVAIFNPNNELCYPEGICDDVMGYQNLNDIINILKKVITLK